MSISEMETTVLAKMAHGFDSKKKKKPTPSALEWAEGCVWKDYGR